MSKYELPENASFHETVLFWIAKELEEKNRLYRIDLKSRFFSSMDSTYSTESYKELVKKLKDELDE